MKKIFLLLILLSGIFLSTCKETEKDKSLETAGLLFAVAPKASTAPTTLTYTSTSSGVVIKTTSIGIITGSTVSLSPTLTLPNGMTASNYSVTPSLPAGLSMNSSTGVISGIATTASAYATYSVQTTLTAGSGFFVNGTNPLVVNQFIIVGSSTQISNLTCSFVGIAGGCGGSSGYSCANSSSCSSSSTCSNISGCAF
ncbi:MAG: putative Ig domain-containing protein [Leptospira sp.]|nr:putative Ig domain-containing protein [Leptospira sp.]